MAEVLTNHHERVGQRDVTLFSLTVSSDSLIITLPRAGCVVSSAPVQGGICTHTNHILIHRVGSDLAYDNYKTILRRAASKAELSGSIVGMFTMAAPSSYQIGNALHEDLQTSVVCLANRSRLVTVGQPGLFVERQSSEMRSGGINLIIATNYRLTQEAMMEAMIVATEAKVLVMNEFNLRTRATGQFATGSAMDCVAVTTGTERRYCFASKGTKWGELIGYACLESLRACIRRTL